MNIRKKLGDTAEMIFCSVGGFAIFFLFCLIGMVTALVESIFEYTWD